MGSCVAWEGEVLDIYNDFDEDPIVTLISLYEYKSR